MKRIVLLLSLLIGVATTSFADDKVEAEVRLTCYTIVGKTASGVYTHRGICAVSPDLERRGFHLGEYVEIKGYGKLLIADRTAKHIKNTIDIWCPTVKEFKHSGKKVKATLVYAND